MRIAIIGGGIAGLAAAYELEKARAAGAPVEYTLFESRDAAGRFAGLGDRERRGAGARAGLVSDREAGGCRACAASWAWAPSCCPQTTPTRKTYIVVRNRLVPLPDGLMFLVPTKLIPTALTRLFSPIDQDAHGAGAAASAAAERRTTNRWPRWWSGTLGRRRSTGWPIRCSRGIYGGDADATERAHCAAAAGGDGDEVRLADARHAGGAQADAAKRRRRRTGAREREGGQEQRAAADDLYHAARRHAAAGRCAGGAARSGVGAAVDAGERASRRRQAAGRCVQAAQG